jgi:hypothetical protein
VQISGAGSRDDFAQGLRSLAPIDQTLFPQGKPADPAAISMLVEQYKLAVQVWDRIRARRQQSNAFYLSINSALLVAFTAITTAKAEAKADFIPKLLTLPLFFAGLLICVLWLLTILNYKSLTDRKYEIIMRLEQALPSAPFSAESWNDHGRPIQRHFTWAEFGVAAIFFCLYAALALVALGVLHF